MAMEILWNVGIVMEAHIVTQKIMYVNVQSLMNVHLPTILMALLLSLESAYVFSFVWDVALHIDLGRSKHVHNKSWSI